MLLTCCVNLSQAADCSNGTFIPIRGQFEIDAKGINRVVSCDAGEALTRGMNADDDDCVACPKGMYNLDGSSYHDGLQTGVDAFCLSCPEGFTCHRNVVKNSAGYWGIVVSRTIYPKINGKPCWNSHIELVEPNDTAVNACRNRTEFPDGTICANRGSPDEAYCSYDVDDGACARCSNPISFSSTKLNLSQVESHQCQEGACLATLHGGLSPRPGHIF